MFFLGIAGSFMPYLICFGVLFFLTIGTNDSLNIDLAELEEKKIEDVSPNSFKISVDDDCYFFNSKITKEKVFSDEIPLKHPNFFIYRTQRKFIHLNIPVFEFQYGKSYSGLSPPELIS